MFLAITFLNVSSLFTLMKIAVMIPTYNEAGNIKKLIEKIRSLKLNTSIVVVDDNSPDGTWKIAKEMGVHLVLRKKNKGRGWAGIDGFKKCLSLKPDYVIEMDADFSHNPKYIPSMLRAIKNSDVVLGSRYLGSEERKDIARDALSAFAKRYVNFLLGFRFTDPLSGYRCFKASVLSSIVDKLKSRDYFIVTESLYRLVQKKFKIVEIPIVFEKRAAGESKLEIGIVVKYFFNVLKLRLGNY